jgi:hypothetical protein
MADYTLAATNAAGHGVGSVLVRLLDDGVYFGLLVYAYNYAGIDRYFIPGPAIGSFGDAPWMQALRWGVMFGTMQEVRRWFESMGIHTDLVSYYLRFLY